MHVCFFETETLRDSPERSEALAQQSGVPDAFDHMVALVLQVPDALERMAAELPEKFPQRVLKPIQTGMLAQAQKFIDELA